jgi:hypothetical protein
MAQSLVRHLARALCVLAALPLGACSVSPANHDSPGSPEGPLGQSPSELGALPPRFARTVPWGDDASALRFQPRALEALAAGPDAVALTPEGQALVLDRLARRVVVVGPSGKPLTVATVGEDVQDLSSAADGSFAAWSPLRARVWVFQRDGAPAGELAVPRALTMLQRLDLGPSHTLEAHDGYQQTMSLGSPSAPLPLPVVLRTVREGAAFLRDGRGLQCRVQEGVAELWVVEQPSAERERAQVVARHALGSDVQGARIVGVEDNLACVRLESVTSTPEVEVQRRAVCLDAESGHVVLDEPLGRPGTYVPRTELAVGGGRLGFILPVADGLEVRSWRLRRAAPSKEVTP